MKGDSMGFDFDKATATEILAHWDGEGEYVTWYAVEQYRVDVKQAIWLYVGTYDDVYSRIVDDYARPTRIDYGCYFRAIAITANDAKDYFEHCSWFERGKSTSVF